MGRIRNLEIVGNPGDEQRCVRSNRSVPSGIVEQSNQLNAETFLSSIWRWRLSDTFPPRPPNPIGMSVAQPADSPGSAGPGLPPVAVSAEQADVHPQVWNWLNGDPVVIKTTGPGIRSATDKIARIACRFRSGRPISTRGQEPVISPDLRKAVHRLFWCNPDLYPRTRPVHRRLSRHVSDPAVSIFVRSVQGRSQAINAMRFQLIQQSVRIRTARTGPQVRPSHTSERMS